MVAAPVSDTPFGGLRDVTRLRVRAGDGDRHATVLELQRALAEGRLTFEECGDRMAAAFASRYQDDLPPLTADLPPATPPVPAAPGWAVLGQLALTQAASSLGSVVRGQFLRRQLLRWRASTHTRPVLRAVAIGLLVLGATLLGLLLLALAGMAAHHLLTPGYAGGGHHHGWYHQGYGGGYLDDDRGGG